MSQILGAHARKLTEGFLRRQGHYLFEEHFCRIRRARESDDPIAFLLRLCERQSLIVTANLPFEHWTEVLSNERLNRLVLSVSLLQKRNTCVLISIGIPQGRFQ